MLEEYQKRMKSLGRWSGGFQAAAILYCIFFNVGPLGWLVAGAFIALCLLLTQGIEIIYISLRDAVFAAREPVRRYDYDDDD